MADETPIDNKVDEKPAETVPVVIPPEAPAVRKSAKDFIIDRKNQKIEKMQSQKDEEQNDLGLGDEEELSPAGKKKIEKTVGEMIDPVINQVRQQSDEAELAGVLTKYPNLKEIEGEIRTWMAHPAYKDVAVEIIALGLASKKGKSADTSKEKKEADDEAAAGSLGGNTRRSGAETDGKIPDVRKMSDKEVDDLVFKVKTGSL